MGDGFSVSGPLGEKMILTASIVSGGMFSVALGLVFHRE